MCGLSGCIHNNNYSLNINKFKELNNLLKSRGPDNQNVIEITSQDKKIKLGHTRLSIQDLNKNANQPMYSKDKNLIMLFNGEIYNHLILRKLPKLKHINWITNSDTETLLNLFENFEINKVLNILEGMFSIVIYDRNKNKIFHIRDKSGEKPLYIALNKNFYSFASDPIIFMNLPNFNKKISNTALSNFLKHNYIPNPYTIFTNSYKIPPASVLEINLNNFSFIENISFSDFTNLNGVKLYKWWNIDTKNIYLNNNNFNYSEAKNYTHELLINSVKKQQISDVPVGVFLSGGIDSSLIASLISKQQSSLKTFTIGFESKEYDESIYAKKISNYLGTDHSEHIFNKSDLINFIPSISEAFSEPFADSSQIPTMLLSKITSNSVSVALSGDGGDELFCGYNRYIYAYKYWSIISKLPKFLRKKLIYIFQKSPYFLKKIILSNLSNNNETLDNKIKKITNKLMSIEDNYSYYDSMTSEWTNEDSLMSDFKTDNFHIKNFFKDTSLSLINSMMYLDFNNYLTDDILCKVDRSSMNYSLEVRAPFLDPDIINLSFDLPLKYKIKNGETKYLLKDILSKYIPDSLFQRPKKGFAIPIADFMRNDLKNWTSDMLSSSINKKHNFFNQQVIDKALDQHMYGGINNEHKLWSLIQFNSWYDKNIK